MKKGTKQGIKTPFFWWLLLIFSFFFLINNFNQLKTWLKAKKIVFQRQNRVVELESEFERQQEQKEYVQTSDFVEKEAREKLGLAQPNQVKIIVPDWENTPTPAPILSLPNWKKWGKLFF